MTEGATHEPFDYYADGFALSLTPFGANLTFSLREPHPSAGQQQQIRTLGTMRMSVEHLKTMVILMRTQVQTVEESTGVKAEVPQNILNQLNIAREDWESFWR